MEEPRPPKQTHQQRPAAMHSLFNGRLVNVTFMLVAIGSLIFSSMRMQPCSCPQGTSSSGEIRPADVVAGGGKASGRNLRVDSGPVVTSEVRKIRLPRKTDRTAASGSYWSHGSWGRVVRTSSACWAYPAHDSYAVECYHRLISARSELFMDVEQLEKLKAVEVALSWNRGGAPASIGEKLPAKKKPAEKLSKSGNFTIRREGMVIQRYHVPSTACTLGTGTFNFSCIVKINVRYDTIVPNAPPPEVCFMTVGDWGEARKPQRMVADMISEVSEYRMVKFIVSTGDNFYPAGVQTTADPQWIQTFETPFSAQSVTNIRWYISLGNHDQWGYTAQKQYMEDHPRWYLPDFAYTDSIPLYRDAKKISNETIEMAVLNTAGRDVFGQILMTDQFYGTIDRRHGEDKDTSRHWRFMVNHEPLYSGGLHGLIPERNGFVRGSLQPVLQQHMMHAYFNGDDHFLEIHRKFGTDFFTSGGGCGSEVYSTTMRPTTKWNMFTDFLPKGVPALEIVVDGALKRASAKGAMLHCVDGGVFRTHVIDEHGGVMHVYETAYDVDASEFEMDIEEH